MKRITDFIKTDGLDYEGFLLEISKSDAQVGQRLLEDYYTYQRILEDCLELSDVSTELEKDIIYKLIEVEEVAI